ncbi:hypothetical protein EJ04DRAFT_524319 [Polyplosphaeria fusca]|uniref:Uncharacterized protein n=1 Tax=Polyplosphaeria fusca TaxID=682080 RepID=A0A9P4V0M9_9PLEO|nr:hypothetical protein EJ04DRAFT_524319 [Polyplosphaeria fusca]
MTPSVVTTPRPARRADTASALRQKHHSRSRHNRPRSASIQDLVEVSPRFAALLQQQCHLQSRSFKLAEDKAIADKIAAAEKRAVDAEKRAAEAEKRVMEAEKRATGAEKRATETEKRAMEAAKKLADVGVICTAYHVANGQEPEHMQLDDDNGIEAQSGQRDATTRPEARVVNRIVHQQQSNTSHPSQLGRDKPDKTNGQRSTWYHYEEVDLVHAREIENLCTKKIRTRFNNRHTTASIEQRLQQLKREGRINKAQPGVLKSKYRQDENNHNARRYWEPRRDHDDMEETAFA